MFSAFWEKFFEGATLLIPMVHPHMDRSIYPVLGRVLSYLMVISLLAT
jgi:hypothetical protein